MGRRPQRSRTYGEGILAEPPPGTAWSRKAIDPGWSAGRLKKHSERFAYVQKGEAISSTFAMHRGKPLSAIPPKLSRLPDAMARLPADQRAEVWRGIAIGL